MGKPKTLAEAMDTIKATKLTDEEASILDDESSDATPEVEPEFSIPDWAHVPAGFKFPSGKVVSFIRFRAEWTDTPAKGDRFCVIWNLNGADEKNAISRTRGDSMKLVGELSKQMIRVVDGHKADWTGRVGPGSVERWWDDIGAKCRQIVQNHYVKTHSMTQEERQDFFESCIVVRTAG